MDDWFGLQRGLVAVGLLAVVPGCPSDKDNTTESTSTDPGSTGGTGGTSGGTTGGTTGGTSGDTPTGSGTGSATGTSSDATTGDATTGDATTGTTGDATTSTTTGGPALPPECVSYGAKIAECYMDPLAGMYGATYCGEAHAYYEMAYGAECVQAFEAFMACLSSLSCEELTGGDPVCEPESIAQETACTKP